MSGGARVVVAGAEVGVGDELARLAADHGRDLGVGLPVDEAVDHLRAGAFQAAGLADVGGLVEAGLELDERGDRLARLGRLAERGDDRAVARGAVERLLDRQHVGVERGLVQEAHHDVEGLVGVVQQHVLLADRGEDVALEVLHPLGHARGEGRPRAGPRGPTRVSSARSAMPIRPGISMTSPAPTPSACTIRRRRSAGASAVMVSWITSPRRRRFSAVSNSRTRSSASSSTSRSLSRRTRKAQWPSKA